MPYKSKKQRAYFHIHEPKLAEEWDKKYGGKVKPATKKHKPKKKGK
jgi:hypothetical protein